MNLFFICIDTGFIPKASTGQLLVYLYSDVTGIILVIRYCFSSGIPVLVQYSTNTGSQYRFNRGIPVLGRYWFYSFCIVQVKYWHTFTVLIQALYHLPHCRYYRYMPVLKQYCNSTGMFTGIDYKHIQGLLSYRGWLYLKNKLLEICKKINKTLIE